MNKGNKASGKATRISLSIPENLAVELDKMATESKFPSRSAFLTELIRSKALEHRAQHDRRSLTGAITLVYDHHARNLQAKLTNLQHKLGGLILSLMHVHLSHHNCMEVLVVSGPARRLRELADSFLALRGVRHAELIITSAERVP
ncbi:MAG: nickel-responsive transcriptional regulator NikR [Verrucomicrobiota bacterium]|jgi:CopG family nickel-responsive transcriptional regulator|nr:nickel-responsive transcriptional regulator NikR [Verrucomicrobiota bacterium]